MLINFILTGKIIKKILRLTVLVLVIIITAVFTLFSLLRTPSFQEFAGRLAAGFLTRKAGTEIYIDNLRITESLYIQLQGLRVKDHHQQEMLRVDDMKIKVDRFSLIKKTFVIDRVSLDSGGFLLRRYPGDSLLNLDFFIQNFQPDSLVAPDTIPAGTWSFFCNELLIDAFTFGLVIDQPDSLSQGINFDDLLVSEIFVDLKEISVIGDSVAAFLEHIAFREKSGLELLNLSGDAQVSSSGISLKGGQLSTGQTSLDIDMDFNYNGYDKLSDFLDSVNIHARIRSSLITLSDIGYFAPEMFQMEDPVMFSGEINGPVSDFVATDIMIKTGDFTEFSGSIGMTGLPDFYSSFIDLEIENLSTTPQDISGFNLPLEQPNLELPPQLLNLGFTSVQGSFIGCPDDFIVNLDVSSDAGLIKFEGEFHEDNDEGPAIFAGDLQGNAVSLGSLFVTEELGTVNFELEFNGKGNAVEDLNMAVNGWIQDLEFRKHRYDKFIFGGRIDRKSFDGRMMVMDSLLNLGFNGIIDFNSESPAFDFLVDIEKAQLSELHLSDRSEDQSLTGKIKGNFKGTNVDSFFGQISIDNLKYVENQQDYRLNHLELSRVRVPGQPDRTRLRSDYIDGDIEGHFIFKDLVEQFRGFLLGNNDDSAFMQEVAANPQFVSFDLRLKDIAPITELLLPVIEITPGTMLWGQFDSGKHLFELNGKTGAVTISGIQVRDIAFSGVTGFNEFGLDISTRRVILQESDDGSVLSLDNLSAHLETGDSSLNFNIKWDNELQDAINKGSLDGIIWYEADGGYTASLESAEANFNGNLWHIGKDNLLTFDASNIGIRNFRIYKGEENFIVDGILSQSPNDTLNLYFEDWALENFNPLVENFSLQLQGIINGRFGFFRNEEKPNLFAAIHIDDFSLNEVFFGDAEFKTRWLTADQALAIDLNIFSKGNQENPYKILGANGIYYPFDEDRNFDFDITAQNLDISVLEPLLSSFSSYISGFATGKLSLTGTNDAPLLLGKLKLQRAEMQVDYLNVIYSFSNEVVFKEDMIQFGELKVYDPNSNTALLKGGIRHKYFNDMSLDLTIEPTNFMAINLDRYQNEVFYGIAFATGTVRLSGPFENLSIVVDALTEKGTRVYIPINYSVDVSQNNFIVFTSLNDSLPAKGDEPAQVVGVSLDITVNVNSNADIEIFLPGNLGNIKASGNGKLRLGVDPNYYLTLNGSYVIETGLFVFSFEQLVSRRFDILEGSKISWTGDINDAEVNIIARYRLRTDLSGLGITLIDPDAASQKVIVFTDVRMTGNLFNPDLSFGITFPNLQEQTKQAVYAVLDTNDQGLMSQQAISLLVLGSFSSTGSGGSNVVNPAAIVSNTLSNMLSQISNDFNVGINYVPGDQVSSEQLEVALSTQLLDDRLIIDGNFDVTGSGTNSQNTSSIVGDINVEYKLTPDGRFRVKAFNRSNDLSLFNDYAPYTQGVGVFYQKDFNNFQELFRKSGAEPRKKKETK